MPALVPPVVPPGTLARRRPPTLRAGGLVLRSWVATDAAVLAEAYADVEIQRWHGRTMTVDEAREWIAARATRWTREVGADWAVTRDSVVLGRVGLRIIDLAEGYGEVAYWVRPAYRGIGVAASAVDALSSWTFGRLGLHRLELRHSVRNEPSCRVAAKAGFAVEGTLRRQLLHADGWHDMHLHARLAD